MSYSICPICKHQRNSKMHTPQCSKKARLIEIDRTKPERQFYPDRVKAPANRNQKGSYGE